MPEPTIKLQTAEERQLWIAVYAACAIHHAGSLAFNADAVADEAVMLFRERDHRV
jgi:hypothetical protein